jgi:hypothetical protein
VFGGNSNGKERVSIPFNYQEPREEPHSRVRRTPFAPVEGPETGVGTVFIASAVEMQSRWRSIAPVDEVARVLLLHGGRDEYGPYPGSS